MLILALVAICGGLGITYFAYKLYKQAIIEDEILAQQEVVSYAKRAKQAKELFSPSKVQKDMESLEKFLKTRKPRQ
jgi:hypothetical protein